MLNEDDLAAVNQGQAEPIPPPAPEKRSRASSWGTALALYLLGVITGILGLAIYNVMTARPIITGSGLGVLGAEAPEVAMLREAARDGTLDAIATLQAGGGPQAPTPAPAATPTALPRNAVSAREANRLGDPNAPVQIIEFSDFQ